MNKLFVFFLSLALFSFMSCKNNAETTETDDHKTEEVVDAVEFGEAFEIASETSLDNMLLEMVEKDSSEYVTTGKVVEVCQVKGCWMTLTNDVMGDAEPMMVKFKDYGFFMPKDLPGHQVTLKGKAYKQVTSVDELRHYAEDAGKSKEEIEAITEPKEEIVFIASGVKKMD